MNKIITIISIIFLFSCNDETKVKENEIEIQKFTKFETFLKDFLNQNPNWDNNQKTIKVYFKNNDSLFYDHPLQLKFTSENGKFGLFRVWGTDRIKESGLDPSYQNEWYVDVVMEIPKSQIDTLVEGIYYRIIGKFNKYISENDRYFNLLQSWTFEPSIDKKSSSKIVTQFNIGCINIKPTKIETIYGSETIGDYYYLRIHDKNKE